MPDCLTILCENSVGKSVHAIGEHGFSCFIETGGRRFLFDTGQGLGLLHNADLLDVPLESLDGVILSHGHFDHAGGLSQLLQRSGRLPVYGHPQIFKDRFWVGKYEQRPNGIPHDRSGLAEQGAEFDLSAEFREISDGLWLTGEIQRTTRPEEGDAALCSKDECGNFVPDQIEDDCSLVLETARGLIILLGCAHAGLANILHHVVEQMRGQQVYAVIGGMHLAPADDEQFALAVSVLKQYNVKKIGVGHCTGQRRSAELYAEFPKQTFFLSVGSTFRL